MPLITLTTDFGLRDYFVGAVKGALYTELEDARIVDISHQITPFNITETSYIIKNAYVNFPKGTIHVIGVDAELSVENKPIALLLDGHYFICSDNGIMSMITSEIRPEKIVEITIQKTYEKRYTTLDVFVKVASHLARGGTLEVVGNKIETIKEITEVQPVVNAENTQISGNVIYIDNYGNVVSNISKKLFTTVGKGRKFEISARNYTFDKIMQNYNDVVDYSIPQELRHDEGKKLAIFNSAGFLEISIYKSNVKTEGGATSLLGLKYHDNITIRFEKKI